MKAIQKFLIDLPSTQSSLSSEQLDIIGRKNNVGLYYEKINKTGQFDKCH